jgi:hypothetical protein
MRGAYKDVDHEQKRGRSRRKSGTKRSPEQDFIAVWDAIVRVATSDWPLEP